MGLLSGLFGDKIGYGPSPGGVAGGYGGMLNGGYNTSPMGGISDILTGLGVGLLSQGPSSTPISPFAGIGQGLQYANQLGQQRRATGQQQFQNQILSQDAARQQQAFELDKQKGTREQQQFEQHQQRLQAYADTIQDPQAKAAFLVDSEAYIKNVMPSPSPDVQNYNFYSKQEQAAGRQPVPFNDWQLQLKRATANMTTLNMPPAEKAYNTALGQQEGGEIGGIASAGNTARATMDQLATVQALRQALQQTGNDVSALAPIKQKIGAYAQALSLDPNALPGFANGDAAGLYQALGAVTNRLALSNIGTGKEGAIPANNFSEADRNFVVAMSPQLNDTPEGFQAKVLIQQKVAQRNLDKEAMWNSGDYQQLDEGAYRKFKADWAKYVADHPLFTKQERDNFSQLVRTGSATPQVAAPPKAQAAPAVVPSLSGPGWQ